MKSKSCTRCENDLELIGDEFVCLQCFSQSGRRYQHSWILNYILSEEFNIKMCPKRCGNRLVQMDNRTLCINCNGNPSKRTPSGQHPSAHFENAPWSSSGLSTIAIDPVNSRCSFCNQFIAIGDRDAHSTNDSCLQCGTFFGCAVNKTRHYQQDCWI